MATTLVRLLKGCVYGNAGNVVRLQYKEAVRACEKGLAVMHEWKPPVRKVKPDVTKIAVGKPIEVRSSVWDVPYTVEGDNAGR